MKGRLLCGVIAIGTLASWLNAAKPVIRDARFEAPASGVRIMGSPVPLSAVADGDGDPRPLVYQWTIVESATTKEVLTAADQPFARLEIWEFAPGSSLGVGATVKVQLVVNFAEPTAEDLPSDPWVVSIPIASRNQPPVPRILDLGGFGTPSARIPSGTAIHLFDDSTDPDGPTDTVGPNWTFGAKGNVGTYIGSLVMFGSHGSPASFTVPAMTGPIDQEVVLTVKQGLYTLSTKVTTYLAPASSQPPPTGNRAPVLSITQPSVTVTRGQNAQLVATASDPDGNPVTFNWFFNSVTVQQPAVVDQINSTTWRSTLTYPTSSLALGGPYTFTVRARETTTSPPLESSLGTISLYVAPEGGSQQGYFNLTPGVCEAGNSSPQLVSITPDPRVSELRYIAGQQVRVELLFSDSSTKTNPINPLPLTGIEIATWEYSQLTARGVIPTTSLDPGAVPQQAKAVLSFSAPAGQTGESRVSVVARDVLGCGTTVEFGIVFQQSSSGTQPVAVIRYDTGSGFQTAVDNQVVAGPASRTVQLDASQSQDDGGLANLTFTWQVSGPTGATINPATGLQSTLTLPAGVDGTWTVTLTARDAQQQQSIKRLLVNYGGGTVAGVPTAKVVYSYVEGGGGTSGPHSSDYRDSSPQSRKIRLDARQSTDSSGSQANLDFQWVAFGFPGLTLDSETAPEVNLTVPPGKAGLARVLLVVTDRNVQTKDAIEVSFDFSEDAAAFPQAQLFYSTDEGETFTGPVTNGQQVTVSQRNVVLRAGPQEEENAPLYSWTTGGLPGAVLSSLTGKTVQLALPVGQPGIVTVTLTASNQQQLTRSVELKFAVDFALPTARIVKAPQVITKGEPFEVQGSGISGGGSGQFQYFWKMECCDGLSETGGGRLARLVLPDSVTADEEEKLKLSLVVEEDGVLSAPVVKEIPIQLPRLYFSQWAVGPIPNTNQRFETSIVLVNSLDQPVAGTLQFHGTGPFNPEPPDVTVHDEQGSISGGETVFEVPAGGAKEFTVVGDEIRLGWLEVGASAKLTGHVFYRVVEQVGEGEEIRWEVPILPVLGSEFRTSLAAPGNCSGAACPQIALALVNLGDEPVDVKIVLRDADGTEFTSPVWTLAPGEHSPKFLAEIFKPSILQAFGGGTLSIRALQGEEDGRVTATIIRTVGGLPLSILPVVVQ
ncbi:MAG: hypothetical protein Kow001_15150 [Acidobacteriota bacterium]